VRRRENLISSRAAGRGEIRRREFIAFVGGAAAAWPLALQAQQTQKPVIGFLHSASREENAKRLAAFQKGLSEAGFIEGQNVAIEYRWADGQADRLPALLADLIREKVAVIATPGSTVATVAAKKATDSIPIVFAIGSDPVALGLVASLSRPDGNATGVTSLNVYAAAKRLGLIRELVPQANHYFTLVNPASALAEPFIKDLEAGAANVGIRVDIFRASSEREIDAAFASMPQGTGSVFVPSPDAFFYSRRTQIVALVAQHGLPAIFDVPEYVEAGALASYGNDFLDAMQMAGGYTARILKGEKPADLPVVQAEKFALAINLKTAKTLGLTVPPILLATADEVIE